MGIFVASYHKIYFMITTIILQFEEPLFILITFIKPHCIFVLKKLHFGVFMGEMLSPLVYILPYMLPIIAGTNYWHQ